MCYFLHSSSTSTTKGGTSGLIITTDRQSAWRLRGPACLVFLAVILADSISTFLLYRAGRVEESNPLPQLLQLDLSTFLILKVVWAILGLGFIWYILPRQRKWVRYFVIVALFAYVIWYTIAATISYISSLG